jgi:hypothetical protein
MKKDLIYTMRMSTRVREALTVAANKERRTAASLLDKVITDYLTKEGFLREPEFEAERRRLPRKKITMPAKTLLKAGAEEEAFPCAVLDISLGGVLVTYPKGSGVRFASTGELPQFELRLELPPAYEALCFNCDTRRMHDTGSGIQVGATYRNPTGSCLQKLDSYLGSIPIPQ